MKAKAYKKRILILCPFAERKGGVANYYRVLKKLFKEDDFRIDYHYTGKRSEFPGVFSRIGYSLKDLLWLCKSLSRYDLIHFNPSLDLKGIIRDSIYHFFAKRFYGRKTLVFFRGWSGPFERLIETRFKKLFRIFFNFDYALVLAVSFKKKLVEWGYHTDNIGIDTTIVDEVLLGNFCIEDRINNIDSLREIRLLFLARIEKEKGILEAIEAFNIVSKLYNNICLIVAGEGPFLKTAQQFANRISKSNIVFLGDVRGVTKRKILLESDIYLFPSYTEGMPNSVLEAMAFGLPVITTPIGGVRDFFKDGEHGFLAERLEPKIIASLIEKIIHDRNLWKRIALKSNEYAKERFMSSKVARRLEDIYRHILFS